MRSFTTTVALASLVPAIMSLTINTPSSVVQCQPQLLSWSDGQSPFYLSVIPGGQAAAPPLKTFDTQTGNTLTWTVDQKAGTDLTFSVKDSTGAVAYSDVVKVQQGPDTSCLGSSGSPPAAPPAAQDASVNTSNAPTSGVSTPSPAASSSVVSVQTGTIRPASSASGVTATRAASVASASSSTAQSVSRTTTSSARTAATSSSGAESSLSGHSYGFVGAVGLIGALFL